MEEMPGDLLRVDADDITDAFLEGVDFDVEDRGLLRDGVDGGRSLLLRRVVPNLRLDLRNCSLHLHLLMF
jgi:hypothetical protein